jgi:hypothetical protein
VPLVITKIKIIFSLMLVAMVAAVSYGILFDPTPVTTNGHKENKVTLIVTFTPGSIPRDDPNPVKVTATLNELVVNQGMDQGWVSPWMMTDLKVPAGQEVRLSAFKGRLDHIDCHIVVDGTPRDYDQSPGGGSVDCRYRMPFG